MASGGLELAIGMVTLRDGTVLLPISSDMIIGPCCAHRRETAWVFRSSDNGVTWEGDAPVDFPVQEVVPYGQIRELSDGRLLLPFWGSAKLGERWRVGTLESTDEGKTWGNYREIAYDPQAGCRPDNGFNETDVIELQDHTLLAILRQQRVGTHAGPCDHYEEPSDHFYRAVSHDLGKTWSTPERLDLIGTSPSLYLRRDGLLLLGYRNSRKDANLFADHGEETVEYDPRSGEHLDAIRQMHQREVYGVVRTPEEYRLLFGLPKMRTLTARRNGAATAYLVVSRALNKPGLIEAGGEEAGIETLVHRALAELADDQYLDAFDNLSETTLGKLLRQLVPERREADSKSMMVRINDFPGFFRRIAKWLERRTKGASRKFSLGLADTGEVVGFRFTRAGLMLTSDRLAPYKELSRRELTAAVFGTHSARPAPPLDIAQDLLPFYFPIWVLDHS